MTIWEVYYRDDTGKWVKGLDSVKIEAETKDEAIELFKRWQTALNRKGVSVNGTVVAVVPMSLPQILSEADIQQHEAAAKCWNGGTTKADGE